MSSYLFSSESVTPGHPDKVCDLISDTILDECLKQDRDSRVAVETFVSKNLVVIAGQVTTNAKIDYEKIARDVLKNIGYDNEKTDIDYRTCKVETNIAEQSPDIARGVDIGGAGDQGMMFGYATNETPNFMPYAIDTAHRLSKKLTLVRKNNEIEGLRPDGKTQVTIEYENNKPKRIDTILVSTQHREGVNLEKLKKAIIDKVIMPVIDKNFIDKDTKIYINPTGNFVIGGPLGDTGLTGRKIIVDTYGGACAHGGGAFSGKDASKVDRSAAYMARYIAKNIVANGLADKCELQVSYAIGVEKPVSKFINTFNTNKIPENEILEIIKNKFDLTPKGITNLLKLKEPIYTQTTNYGHFGKDGLPWENIIKL